MERGTGFAPFTRPPTFGDMMKKLLRLWLLLLALLVIPASSLTGCRAEVDDDNGEAELEVGD